MSGVDPVNPGTGESIYRRTLLELPGIGLPVAFVVTNRSRWGYHSTLGAGWTHTFDQRLVRAEDGCDQRMLTWISGDGGALTFVNGSSGWNSEPASPYSLSQWIDGTWSLTDPNGFRSDFDANGLLTRIEDLNGNAQVIAWTRNSGPSEWRVDKVTDTLGRILQFYYKSGYLERVEVIDARLSATMHVDPVSQDLKWTRTLAGVVESYDYATAAMTGSDPSGVPPWSQIVEICTNHCGLGANVCGVAATACETGTQTELDTCRAECPQCQANCADRCDEECRQTGEFQSCFEALNEETEGRSLTSYCGYRAIEGCRNTCMVDIGPARSCGSSGAFCASACNLGTALQCFPTQGSSPNPELSDPDASIRFCFESCLRYPQSFCATPGCDDGSCSDNIEFCGSICDDSCLGTCPSTCTSMCEGGCGDCGKNCLEASERFRTTCDSACFETCATSFGQGPVKYGEPEDIAHNLTRIYDGTGALYLENRYETDVASPSFDRVKWQDFGGSETTFSYFDLQSTTTLKIMGHEGLEPLPFPASVEAEPESVQLCPTSCEPLEMRRERWVEILRGTYGVFDGGAIESVGWPVKVVAATFDAYQVYWLTRTGDLRGELSPLVPRIERLEITTPQGQLTVRPRNETGATMVFAGLEASAVQSLFGQGPVTLVHTPSGWRAYPGTMRGVAELSGGSCASEFLITDTGNQSGALGASLTLEPSRACRGRARIHALRGDPAWTGILTKPGYTQEWAFDAGAVVGVAAASNAGTTQGASHRTDVRRAMDPICERAVKAFGRPSSGFGPPPECSKLWTERGGLPSNWVAPDVSDVPEGGWPALPMGCGVVSPAPGTRSVQAMIWATRVDDAAGHAWVYYSDVAGRVVRIVNLASGVNVDRNFDHLGQLIGERTGEGPTRCMLYNAHGDLETLVERPAPNKPVLVPQRVDRFTWGRYGRLREIFATNELTASVTNEWDDHGNLEKTTLSSGYTIEYREHDRGRPKLIETPAGKTRVTYHPTGAWLSQTLHEGEADARSREVERDFFGLITKLTESGRPAQSWTWRPDGRLRTETIDLDPVLNSHPVTKTFNYDDAGILHEVIEENRTTVIDRNAKGLATVMTSTPKTGETRRSCIRYDGVGRLAETIDGEGRHERLERDSWGEVVEVWRGVPTDAGEWSEACRDNLRDSALRGHEERFLHITRNPDGAASAIAYGAESVAGTEGGPGARRQSLAYDGYGQPIEVELTTGERIRQGFDARGRRCWQARYRANAPGYVEGLVDGVPDVQDRTLASLVKFGFDALDRLESRSELWFVDDDAGRHLLGDDGWRLENWVYDDLTNQLHYAHPDGVGTTVLSLDFFGRPKSRIFTSPDASETETRDYSEDGLTVETTVAPRTTPSGELVFTEKYAPFGGLRQLLNEAGEEIYGASFTPRGLVEMRRDRASAVGLKYTDFDQLESITRQPDTVPYVSLGYDRRGVLKRRTEDQLSSTWTFNFDAIGRIESEISPRNSATTTNTFWPGTLQLRRRVDANGDGADFRYDAYGSVRSLSVEHSHSSSRWRGTTELTYGRDILGLLEAGTTNNPSAADDDVAYTFVRDSRGAAVSQTSNLFADPLGFAYSAQGWLSGIAAGSRRIELDSNGLGELTEVRTIAGGARPKTLAHYDYRPGGVAEDQVTFGNGLVETRGYDAEGRLCGRALSGPQNQLLHRLSPVFGEDGLLGRLDVENGSGSASTIYLHDAYARLESTYEGLQNLDSMTSGEVKRTDLERAVQRVTPTEHFTITAGDDWSAATRNGRTVTATPDVDHRYADFGGTVQTDTVGNPTRLPDGTKYAFDGLGNLVQATTASGQVWRFTSDPFGQLASWSSSHSSGTVEYVGGRVIRLHSIEGQGTKDRLVVPGDGAEPLALWSGEDITYLHEGWGGRAALATDEQGQVVERYAHSAYGVSTTLDPTGQPRTASAIDNRLLFTGGLGFPELGLHRMGARWLRPEWGRFVTPDPLGFVDGPNRFAYVGNRPLMFMDPFGLNQAEDPFSGLDPRLTLALRQKDGRANVLGNTVDQVRENVFTPQEILAIGLVQTLGPAAPSAILSLDGLFASWMTRAGAGAYLAAKNALNALNWEPVYPAPALATAGAGVANLADDAGRAAGNLADDAAQGIAKVAEEMGSGGASNAAETPVRAGEVTTFEDFVDRSVVGDGLEGHELWQHANLKANGLATERLSTAASKNNPVIALERPTHQQVNSAQRAIDASAQTPLQNIEANAAILRALNIAPDGAIGRLTQMAIEHAKKLGF